MRKFDFFQNFHCKTMHFFLTFQFYIKKYKKRFSFEVHFVDVAQEIRELAEVI